MLYMLAELVEFSPAIAEWLGWKRIRRILHGLTLGAVIFGITLRLGIIRGWRRRGNTVGP